MAKDKDRNVIIVDRSAPRVAIQITEIAVDAKKKSTAGANPSRI